MSVTASCDEKTRYIGPDLHGLGEARERAQRQQFRVCASEMRFCADPTDPMLRSAILAHPPPAMHLHLYALYKCTSLGHLHTVPMTGSAGTTKMRGLARRANNPHFMHADWVPLLRSWLARHTQEANRLRSEMSRSLC